MIDAVTTAFNLERKGASPLVSVRNYFVITGQLVLFRLMDPEPDANAFRLIKVQQTSGQRDEEWKFFKESSGSKIDKRVKFLSGLFKSAFPRETEESPDPEARFSSLVA